MLNLVVIAMTASFLVFLLLLRILLRRTSPGVLGQIKLSNTTYVNYSLLSGTCAHGFLYGLSVVYQNAAAIYNHWDMGSDNTTQVTYAIFGGSYYGSPDGFSTFSQNAPTTLSHWSHGSIKE